MAKRCIIRVRDLHKGFGEKKVLRGVSLDIEAGRVTTIIGKSGEGKSVLLKCVAGILKPDAGGISIDCGGESWFGGRRGNGRRQLSYMFEHNALFDSMTAFENVALPLRERTRMKPPEIRARVEKLFEQLDLGEVGETYPGDLSGGMQKRVALARALVFDPEIVLFDEPTTGLDPLRKNAVFGMIEHYQEVFGYTAVVVSHDLPDVLYFSDRVATLRDGRVAFDGTPLQLEQSATEFSEGFLHSRDDLQDELSGLESASALGAALPELARDNRVLAIVWLDDYTAIAKGLGQLAAHLIESSLVRRLRLAPVVVSKRAFALERGMFVLTLQDAIDTGSAEWQERAHHFVDYLRSLGSNRCVEFAIRVAQVPATDVASPSRLIDLARHSPQTFFQFRC